MRIGILTQPLNNNYGGLLQNYALQKVLRQFEHEVHTINIKNRETSKFRRLASILIKSTQRLLGQNVRLRTWPNIKESELISHNTSQFVRNKIITTDIITKKVDASLLRDYNFDAYIVGSDQVWRPKYSPQLPTYFLDFLEHNPDVKKIAYAASFGVDHWEFTKNQTAEFKKLIKLFDAVSVREDSGVELCKKHFDIEAIHLLDPTMLLTKDDYISIVEKENIKESLGNLFTYILDSSKEKNIIVDNIANNCNLKPFSVMQSKRFSDKDRKGIDDCVFPPVEQWIRGFMDAEFVVTDSFHGTVFSILFNKPFISIANKSRGITRFKSLLKLFQLEDRLVIPKESFNVNNIKKIDFLEINNILLKEKEKSISFLRNQLN
ncbi:MAG: polysaccharide pyruvyl transferase family protein [Tissierellia bacterium]|nr:polysaccharide pyruvyl transferase family protein [Tissierellia bacterium]